MKKKIIGYKLIKPEMYKAASMILYGNHCGSASLDTFINVKDKPHWIEILTLAAVLDIWFEPIYEEVKPEFMLGDWVYADKRVWGDHRNLQHIPTFQIQEISYQGEGQTYLRPVEGESTGVEASHCRLATDKEIDAYLFEEAKRRYPIGTKIHPVHLSGEQWCISEIRSHNRFGLTDEVSKYITFAREDNGWLPTVYNKETGTWAEIVEEPLVINGYTAKFHEDSVSFGCQNLTAEFIFRLVELTENSISIHDMGGKDLKEELTKIYNRLKQ